MASIFFAIKLALILTLCVLTGRGSALQTLFSWEEPVAQFTADNFTLVTENSDTAWMIDFYATWCGHCQTFAPTWVQFARHVVGWSRVLRVGAIACSDPQNVQVCRAHEIRGYPSVKFYPPRTHPQHQYATGRLVSGRKTVVFLRHTAVDYLMQAMNDRINPMPQSLIASWPKLEAVTRLEDIIALASPSMTRYIFVVAEDSSDAQIDSHLGREVILSMSDRYPAIIVGRILGPNAERVGIRTFPSLHVHEWPDYVEPFWDELHGVNNKAAMLDLMQNYASRIRQQTELPADVTGLPERTPPPAPVSTAGPSDGLHMQDLESGIYYSLWIEVGGRGPITGPALRALKGYLAVLAKYHPGRPHIVNFLSRVSLWLRNKSQMTGQQWLDGITALQTPNAYVPDRVSWTGCKGSREPFRGYPCSVWMTFHSLTVNALDVAGRFPHFDPEEVPRAMKGYIREFFGCRHCARHFGKMGDTMEEEVTSRTDGVMWLWKSHNKANNRLHLDPTEDPVHPKIQFPRYMACSSCRRGDSHEDDVIDFDNSTSWSPEYVLSYLRWFYGKMNIIQDALPFEFVLPAVGTPIPATIPTQPRPPTTQEPTTKPPTTITVTEPPVTSTVVAPSTEPTCIPRETLWSPCSKTCDVGVSTRLSNSHPGCQMKMEMRLCNVRPCRTVEVMRRNYQSPSNGQSCPDIGATFRVMNPSPMVYGNCRSLEEFFGRNSGSKICGLCPGRCCYPSRDRTIELHMQCGDHTGRVKVQYIDVCDCPTSCPRNYQLWYMAQGG